jgi:hypothetical protein
MTVPIMLGVGAYAALTQPHAQRHELRVGTTGSPTEPCSETTLSAEEIYDRLRAGTQYAAMHDARAELQQLAGKYATRLVEIKLLTSQMEESWHGDAADGAARYSHPATEVLESSGVRLDESARDHGPLDRQNHAYDKVLSTVVQLPAKPESSLLNTINPFETDTDRAIKKYNDDAARNIAAYADYYTASGENGRAMPHQFPLPPSGPAPQVVVVPAHGDARTGPRSTDVPAPAVAAGGGSVPTVSASAGTPVPGGPTWTTPAYDPVSGTAPQSWPTDAGKPLPVGPAPAAAAVPPVPGGAGAAGGALGGVYSRPGDGVGSRRPGGLGGAGGAVESGPRAQGGAEARGRGGVVGAAGSERGAAATGGAPGTRRGKDSDEDKEHKTKYLENEDLGKHWGPTGPVAPPVIGDRR